MIQYIKMCNLFINIMGVVVVEWLSSWLAEQEVRGWIPGLTTPVSEIWHLPLLSQDMTERLLKQCNKCNKAFLKTSWSTQHKYHHYLILHRQQLQSSREPWSPCSISLPPRTTKCGRYVKQPNINIIVIFIYIANSYRVRGSRDRLVPSPCHQERQSAGVTWSNLT